jgi:hypothetical protein
VSQDRAEGEGEYREHGEVEPAAAQRAQHTRIRQAHLPGGRADGQAGNEKRHQARDRAGGQGDCGDDRRLGEQQPAPGRYRGQAATDRAGAVFARDRHRAEDADRQLTEDDALHRDVDHVG